MNYFNTYYNTAFLFPIAKYYLSDTTLLRRVTLRSKGEKTPFKFGSGIVLNTKTGIRKVSESGVEYVVFFAGI